MRIVRTETYIEADKSPFGQGAHRLQGFSAAWVTKPSPFVAGDPEVWQLMQPFAGSVRRPRWRVVGAIRSEDTERFLPPFVAICLRNFPRPRSIEGYLHINISGDPNVEYILAQPIVVEHSPPEWVQLLDFLKGASPALLLSAYFIGVRNTSLLLLARIGAGYILLSSAIGLSRWLEDGQFPSIARRASQWTAGPALDPHHLGPCSSHKVIPG
jgi:hypothetical protein